MKSENKSILSEEHLRKIKYRTGYRISESPKYRPLVNDGEEFDEMPVITNEAGDQEDAEKPGGGQVPPAPSNDEPLETGMPPEPAFDKGGEEQGMPPADPMGAEAGMPPVDPMEAEPEPQVDDIQNDIIKHNIEAMKSIHSQLEMLNNSVQGLNSKMAELNADVEEVREPTNTEKLMNKGQVSYPYYFNLNDLWSDNWFNEKRKESGDKGIKKLPDGTYVADFDDLPHPSKIDIQNSFNEIV
jgi:hypothetical protein